MSLFRCIILVWLAAASGVAPAADDALDARLKSLLEHDAESQTDGKLSEILKFYKAAGETPISKWLSQGLHSDLLSTNDPRLIATFAEIVVGKKRMTLSPETQQLIEDNPPEALSAAIRLSQDGFSDVARMAADVVNRYRDQLTSDHWKSILDGRQYVVLHRESYPAGIHAHAYGYSLIPMGYVFLPASDARSLDLDTEVFYDGKPKYPRGMHGLGWRSDVPYIGFGKVAIGRHRIQLKTTYEFKLGDVAISGTNVSPEYEIEITAADTPDHLAAELDQALIADVEASIQVGSRDEGRQFTYSQPVADGKFEPIAKIIVPAIKVTKPLPVSLCMKPEIYVEGEAKPLTRMIWRVPPGKTTKHILENWAGDPRLRKFLQDNVMPGEALKAKLVLRPSRQEALSDPSVEKYYPQVIEREIEFRWSKVDEKKP